MTNFCGSQLHQLYIVFWVFMDNTFYGTFTAHVILVFHTLQENGILDD